jgi:hypothetical protein
MEPIIADLGKEQLAESTFHFQQTILA